MTETIVGTEAETKVAAPITPRLKTRYADEIKPALLAEFGYSNVMQVPGVVKVVVNMGVGEAARDAKLIDGASPRSLGELPGLLEHAARGRLHERRCGRTRRARDRRLRRQSHRGQRRRRR